MNLEKPTFEQLDQQRAQTVRVFEQRKRVYTKIGTGDIKIGDTWESTERVGEVKDRVAGSIERMSNHIERIDTEFEERAIEYQNLLTLRKNQLEKMTQFVAKGHLTAEDIKQYQDEYELLEAIPTYNPGLQRGLDKLVQTSQSENLTTTLLDAEITPLSSQPKEDKESLDNSEIPSILNKLNHIESVHQHKYNLEDTISGRLAALKEHPDKNDLTEEELQIISDYTELSKYTGDVNYLSVYTPQELHDLVEKFKLISQKNRPDFNEVEDKIIAVVDDKLRKDRLERDTSLNGVIARANKNAANRRGMQWATLIDYAEQASTIIQSNMISTPERRQYLIAVKDPNSQTEVDLSAVYQFVANDHINDVLGRRSERAHEAQLGAFVENCQIINDWYASVEEKLESLSSKPQFCVWVREIRDYISTMNIRHTGGTITGITKRYDLDTPGAINLQKRIGYTVDTIRTKLATQQTGDEIVPLQ
jgi:hypothetical protein